MNFDPIVNNYLNRELMSTKCDAQQPMGYEFLTSTFDTMSNSQEQDASVKTELDRKVVPLSNEVAQAVLKESIAEQYPLSEQVVSEIDPEVTESTQTESIQLEEGHLEKGHTASEIGTDEIINQTELVAEEEEKIVEKTTPVASSGKSESVVITAAGTAALAVNNWGVGGVLLHRVIAFIAYKKAMEKVQSMWWVGGYVASLSPVQYLVTNKANEIALKGVSYPLIGNMTAGKVATVAFAVITAVTVAEIGAGIHNLLIAKTDEEKISVNPFSMGLKAIKMLSGWGSGSASAPI